MPGQRGVVNSPSGLNHYNRLLKRRQTSFRCPVCTTPTILLSRDFQKHCKDHHQLNPKLCCVWCRGRVRWAAGHKYSHADHLIQCWQSFMARYAAPVPPRLPPPGRSPRLPPPERPPTAPPPPTAPQPSPSPGVSLSSPFRPDPILFDSTPMCAKEDFFGHERVDVDRLFNPVWPVPLRPNSFMYSDEGLDLAASCVRMYIELRDTMDFYHAMVRLVAFPHFLRAMDADEGRSRTLPFSTLCDGGRWREARHRQHRHLIVVSPKGHFVRHVWSKIRIPAEDRPRANYKCLKKFPILSPTHLINALGYLSQRESRCDFSKDETTENPRQTSPLNHFWIFTTLPKDFRLPLFAQYDNGLLDLLRQNYTNFSMEQLLRFPLVYSQSKWRLKIKHLPSIRLGVVLPVASHLRPCSLATTARLSLVRGRALHFEGDARPDTWLRQQAEGGNLFYHAVGEEYFTLRSHLQRVLQYVKPTQAENARLGQRNARLEQRDAERVAEVERLRQRDAELVAEVERQTRRARSWKRRAKRRGREAAALRRENERLRRENARWRRASGNRRAER